MKFVWQNGRRVSPYFLKKDEIQESTLPSSSQRRSTHSCSLGKKPIASYPEVSQVSPSSKNKAIDLDALFKELEYKPSERPWQRQDRNIFTDFDKKSKFEELIASSNSGKRSTDPCLQSNNKPIALQHEVSPVSHRIVSPYFSRNNNPDWCSSKNKAIDTLLQRDETTWQPPQSRNDCLLLSNKKPIAPTPEVSQGSLRVVSPYFSNNNNPDSCSSKNKAIDLDTLCTKLEYRQHSGPRKRSRDSYLLENKKPVALETTSLDVPKESPRIVSKYFMNSNKTDPCILKNERFEALLMQWRCKRAASRRRENEQILKPPKKSRPLSAAEKRNRAYKRRTPDNTWVPPRSFIPLIQEDHVHDPWRVLCVCILLNKTSGQELKNREIISNFFILCPNAQSCIQVGASKIKMVISALGFGDKRPWTLVKFSREYLEGSWTYVHQLSGIDRYGSDAYALFCTGMWDQVTPHDKMLIRYWSFLHWIKHKL